MMKVLPVWLGITLASGLLSHCSQQSSALDSVVESRIKHLTHMTKILEDKIEDCGAMLTALRQYHQNNRHEFGDPEGLGDKIAEVDLMAKYKERFIAVSKKLVPVLMKAQQKCPTQMKEIETFMQAHKP